MRPHFLLAVSVLLAASAGMLLDAGQDKMKLLPTGQAPRFFTVTEVGKDHIELSEVGPTIGDIRQAISYRPALRDIDSFDGQGKKLSADELLERVKAGTVVLVAAEEKMVDPAYRSVLKDDAVILVGVVMRVEGVPLKPRKSVPAASAGEADRKLVEVGRERLKANKYTPMPVYSAKGKLGSIQLLDGTTAELSDAVLVGKDFDIVGLLRLGDGFVFFNVDKTGPLKVGDYELKKGECVLFQNQQFSKLDLTIAAE